MPVSTDTPKTEKVQVKRRAAPATAVLVTRPTARDGDKLLPITKTVWPAQSRPSKWLITVAHLALASGKPVARKIRPAKNKAVITIIATPLRVDASGAATAALAMVDPAKRPSPAPNVAPAPVKPNTTSHPLADANRARSAVELLARLNQQSRFNGTCLAFVNEISRLTGAFRVAVGFIRDGSASVKTVSGNAQIGNKTVLLQDLAMAMNEAIDQACTIVYPSPSGSSGRVTLNHNRFTVRHASPVLCTVPIATSDESGRALIGALSLEFGNARQIDAQAIQFVEHVSALVAQLLDSRRQLDQPVAGRVTRALSSRSRRDLTKRSTVRKTATAVAAVIALAALLVPVPYRVSADARLEGAQQRILAAPIDGFVGQAHVRPGEMVNAGDLMVSLDDRELVLERDKWAAQIEQTQKKYGEALATENQSEIAIQRARLAQANAQLQTLDAQLDRMQLTAPFDGVVLDGDLTQALGAPVARGQTLMTLSPVGQLRIIIEVDERDIATVDKGSQGQLVLEAVNGEPVDFKVERVSPVAVVNEQGNVFEVQAALVSAPGTLRPGLAGVAKITAGERSLLASATARLRHWLRMTLWKWRI